MRGHGVRLIIQPWIQQCIFSSNAHSAPFPFPEINIMHQKAGGENKKKSRLLEKPEPDVCVKSGNVTTLLLVTFEQSGIVSGRPDEAGGRDGNNNISMYTNWHPSHGSECFAAGGRLSLSMCGIYIYIQGRKTRHRRVGRVVGGG